MTELFDGITLTGRYLDDDDDPVGSFIFHHGGQCVIIETPPDEILPAQTQEAWLQLGKPELLFISETHSHEDHYDAEVIQSIEELIPTSLEFCKPHPWTYESLWIGGEPLWVISCPKHSPDDLVFVFRGVALTGDIELGQVESVNDEVVESDKIKACFTWPALNGSAVTKSIPSFRPISMTSVTEFRIGKR